MKKHYFHEYFYYANGIPEFCTEEIFAVSKDFFFVSIKVSAGNLNAKKKKKRYFLIRQLFRYIVVYYKYGISMIGV